MRLKGIICFVAQMFSLCGSLVLGLIGRRTADNPDEMAVGAKRRRTQEETTKALALETALTAAVKWLAKPTVTEMPIVILRNLQMACADRFRPGSQQCIQEYFSHITGTLSEGLSGMLLQFIYIYLELFVLTHQPQVPVSGTFSIVWLSIFILCVIVHRAVKTHTP